MSVVSEGDFSLAVDAMRLCVASSKTYQEVTGSNDKEHALGTVVFAGEWESEIVDTARCLVRQDGGLFLNGEQNGGAFVGRIPFLVLFEIPIPKAYTENFSDTLKWFSNQNGRILRQMLKSCRQRPSEMPDIRSVDDTIRPGLYDPDEQQDNYIGVAEYRFEAVIEMVLEDRE